MAHRPTAIDGAGTGPRGAAAGTPGAVERSLVSVVRRAAGADEAAIAELYRRRFDLVFRAARRATGRDEQFCLDVVQETFLRVMRGGRAMAGLVDEEHVDRWLMCVTQTAALDLLRGERRRVRREQSAAEGALGALDTDTQDRIAWLVSEIARLPTEDRELLRMKASGMTLAMIAGLIGSTVGATHGRVRRVVAALGRAGKEAERGR